MRREGNEILIDPSARIDPKAKLADDVIVGPWTFIGPDVEIGAGTEIGSHVVIKGPTRIGSHNRIFQFSTLGEECQDRKYNKEPTRLEIGDHNIFREACTVHRGTVQDHSLTRIGDNNLFMVNVHVAHDCVIGNHCVLANDTNLAGHVHLGDYAILGGATQVHQFCKVGAYSMCGTGSIVLKDVPAYVIANGNTAEPHGINVEGLKRKGFSQEAIRGLRQAYKTLYRQGLTLKEAQQQLNILSNQLPEVELLYQSLVQGSGRGIIR
jgi:UDP-N-acetylglucosamine acyltransferase